MPILLARFRQQLPVDGGVVRIDDRETLPVLAFPVHLDPGVGHVSPICEEDVRAALGAAGTGRPLGFDDMCTFCEIARGELDAHFAYQDDGFVAFLDFRPIFPGHTLLIPRDHHETLIDLPGDLVGPFFTLGQRLARAIPAAMDAKGTFVAMNNVVSQSVPHLHLHVVPRRPKDGLRGFFWPRMRYKGGDAEMAEVATAIATQMRA